MIICLSVSERTKSGLDSLLELGQYRDYSEAVAVAVANQLVFHTDAKQSGRMVLTPGHVATKQDPPATSRHEAKTHAAGIPAAFAPIADRPSEVKTAPFPNDIYAPGQDVPVDRWIFGQHNKLLPVKATCRAL